MKRAKDEVDQRRKEIFSMIEKVGDVKVEELSEMFKVSAITLRRDLQYLEDQDLVKRYYGGVSLAHPKKDQTLHDELTVYRQSISKYAAGLVENNDTIFINSSRTAIGIIPFITAKNVTVITNNGNAINMQHSSNVTIILTGGELRHIKGTMVGDFTLDHIQKVAAKKTFLGCSGLSTTVGMTTDHLEEVRVNKAMFEQSEVSYILADHKKIGKICSFVSVEPAVIKNVITDEKVDLDEVHKFNALGINIVQVKKED